MAWPLRRVLAKGVLINTTWNPPGSFRLFSWCLWPFQNCRYQTKPFLSPENCWGVWEQIAWFCFVKEGKQGVRMKGKGIPDILQWNYTVKGQYLQLLVCQSESTSYVISKWQSITSISKVGPHLYYSRSHFIPIGPPIHTYSYFFSFCGFFLS